MIEFLTSRLAQLDSAQIQQLIDASTVVTLNAGEPITQEGKDAQWVYFILSGQATVEKRIKASDEEQFWSDKVANTITLKKFSEGTFIGEACLILGSKYTQSVNADTTCTLLKTPITVIQSWEREQPKLHRILMNYFSQNLVKRVRHSNMLLTDELFTRYVNNRKRNFFTTLLLRCVVIILIFLVGYDVVLVLSKNLDWVSVGFGIALITLISLYILSIEHRPTLSFFGWHKLGWRQSLYDSAIATVVMCAVLTVCKWLLLNYSDYQFEHPGVLFHFAKDTPIMLTLLFILMYALFCIPQELVVRGFLQTSFTQIFREKRPFKSIFFSNFLFMSVHIPWFGLQQSVLTFIAGLWWGWIYHKRNTLIGATASHMFTGVFALFILGFK